MEVLQSIKDYINYFDKEMSDPRSKNFLIIKKPEVLFASIALYLVLVKLILPAYMKNRPAYKLKKIIMYYNIFQVIINIYIMYLAFGSGYVRRYSLFKCRDLDESTTDSDAMMGFYGAYYYMLLKFSEYFDTFFFLLRKKENQVSFLHVYHHASMTVNAWLVFKFLPGGTSLIAGGINCWIHVVMYTYYLLAGLGPKWKKYIWWKKYLTTFQIIQFIIGLIMIVLTMLTLDNCPNYMKRKHLIIYAAVYICSLLVLFTQFYKKSYNNKSKEKELNGTTYKVKSN